MALTSVVVDTQLVEREIGSLLTVASVREGVCCEYTRELMEISRSLIGVCLHADWSCWL